MDMLGPYCFDSGDPIFDSRDANRVHKTPLKTLLMLKQFLNEAIGSVLIK